MNFLKALLIVIAFLAVGMAVMWFGDMMDRGSAVFWAEHAAKEYEVHQAQRKSCIDGGGVITESYRGITRRDWQCVGLKK